MVSFFQEKSPASAFRIIFISIILRAHFMVHSPQVIVSKDDGLLYYLLAPFTSLPSLTASILYHVIILLQALRLNYILNDLRMFQKATFTTALAYILLTALLPHWGNITAALLANSLLIWLLEYTGKLFNADDRSVVYNTGLVAGICIIAYYATAPVCLLVFCALAIMRPLRLNEWFILLLGIITPAYFYIAFLFLNDRLHEVWMVKNVFVVRSFNFHGYAVQNIIAASLTSAVSLAAVITGIYAWQTYTGKMMIQVHKHWLILLIMLVLFVVPVFFMENNWPFALLGVTVPATAFVSNAFSIPRQNNIPVIYFWLLVVLIVYNNWWMR